MKYCINCKHMSGDADNFAKCTHPQVVEPHAADLHQLTDLVTGKKNPVYCSDMRSSNNTVCGPYAKLFESKEEK